MRPLQFLFLPIVLCGLIHMEALYAQTASDAPQPPSFFGGNPALKIDLKEQAPGTIKKVAVYDFVKFNPTYRSLLPTKRKCSTTEMEEDRKIKHGGESQDEFEEWMQKRTAATRGLRKKSVEVYSIPVVVHVIYSNPTENISKEQVLSQIRVLNQDYRRRNPDAANTLAEFRQTAADTEIEFCLASIDPFGNPTEGIERISIGGSPFSDRYLNEVIKPNTIWDPERYMNIWVCNIAGGILGFAQFPSSSGLTGIPNDPGAENTDGVVIHYNAFGTMGTANPPFNRGRTATHEIGHWLGLRHIWGDGPCEIDDFCPDTPEASDPNFSCPGVVVGCFGKAMFQNFMDYTDDACMNLFTLDQKIRMRAVLENSPRRRTLPNSGACRPPDNPPIADFTADVVMGCGPLLVNFKQTSQGDPDSFEWTFSGGTPATSTQPNPRVIYNTPGKYRVRLVASNGAGPGPAKVREGYIEVISRGISLPLVADFEKNGFPPSGFLLHDPQTEYGWTQTPRVSANGTGGGAMTFNNYENNLRQSVDWMLTPVMDFSTGQKTTLAFDVAYSRYNQEYSDTLGVFISTGCKTVFEAIYFQGGTTLSTSGEDYVRSYTPFPEEWRKEYIDLSAYDGEPMVQIAFINFSGYGNNIFVDNIKVASRPKPVPTPAFLASASQACEGETIEFENRSLGDITSLSWTFPGGLPGSDTSRNPVVTYPKAGTYDVILTAVNAAGSRAEIKKSFITIKPGPILTLNTEEADICVGSSKQLSATGALSYVWSPKKGLNQHKNPIVTASPEVTTTYQVTGTNANGCKSSRNVTIRVNESTSFWIDPLQATICKGQSVELNATGAGAFEWSPAVGLSQTTGSRVSASPDVTTTYRVTGKNEGGCTFSKEVTVKVEAAPTVYVRAEKTDICPGEEVRIRAAGADRYRWSSSTDTDIYDGEMILVAPLETTTYQVSSGTVGCYGTANVTLTVREKPKVTSADDQYLVCKGQSAQLKVDGATTFRWLTADGLEYNRGATVTVKPTRSTDYTVIGSSLYGCSDTMAIKVIVPRPPEISITSSHPTICAGMSTRLSANGAAEYLWSPITGLDKAQGPVVSAKPAQSTTYTLTAKDQFGCTAKRKVTVNVAGIQSPIAAFGTDRRTICSGQTIQFHDRSRFATQYSWEFPGGIPATSTVQNPKVTYKRPGVYDVILRIEGCTGPDQRVETGYLTVTDGKMLSVTQKDVEICKGGQAILEATGVMEYRWAPVNALDSYTEGRVKASPEENTTYSVSGIDENGCESKGTVHVTVRGSGKKVKIRSVSNHICAGEQIKLKATGADSFIWTTSTGAPIGNDAELVVAPNRTTTYVVSADDPSGCQTQDEVTIEVKPVPDIRVFPSLVTLCMGDTAELEARGGFSYEWVPFDGLGETEGSIVEVFPLESTTYIVKAVDGFGCEGQAEAKVEIKSGKSIQVKARDEVVCLGNSTVLTASGGANYEWSPVIGMETSNGPQVTVRPKETTTYTVTSSDDLGCPGFAAITVKVPEPAPLTITPPTAKICKGESLQLIASGGATYRWESRAGLSQTGGASATVSPIKTTTYNVSSTDPQWMYFCWGRDSGGYGRNRDLACFQCGKHL